MTIEVKGINGVLVLKCQDCVSFDTILNDLDKLLEQPIFQQDSYYPRAFFDFGCRQLQEKQVKDLILLLNEKKRILFEGINTPTYQQHIEMKKQQIHNGEEVFVNSQTLFLGVINKGAYVYCFDDVYFLNEVKGTIVAMNENVNIYGRHFNHAQIIINRKTLQDLTTFAFTSVYYKDNEIKYVEEDVYDKNHSFNFG